MPPTAACLRRFQSSQWPTGRVAERAPSLAGLREGEVGQSR